MKTGIEKMSGMGGCFVISNTSANTGLNVESFVINADAVIAAIEESGTSGTNQNVLASMGLSGVTLKSGMFFTCTPGNQFTKITLTSGSIICYK